MGAGKKVLIADDEKNLVSALKLAVEASGFETAAAYDGAECLTQVALFQPDLILLDILMPVHNGLEICQKLKNDPATRHIPIIILTAGQYLNSAEEASRLGAHSYFLKPFSLESLLAAIREVLLPNP